MDAPDNRPTVEEIIAHPAFPNAVWNLKATQAGTLPVAVGRGGPFNISWEIHGKGDIKLVWIMGLGAIKSAWQRQTLHFGHEQGDKYSCLVLDNRGMGKSDVPLLRYSTSEMARDLIEVLDNIGWTKQRQLHAVGVSMGGMIGQELAILVPERICSLTLESTAARIENTTTFMENMSNRIRMFVPKSLSRSVSDAAASLFPEAWLVKPDDTHLPSERSPEVGAPVSQGTGAYSLFSSNYERFAAQELSKRLDETAFTKKGFILQAIAAGWHHKSDEQLRTMADKVGRERIAVLHGTEDVMITVHHGRVLIDAIQPKVGVILEGLGHVLFLQMTEWHNKTVEELVARTEAMPRT